MTESQYIWKLIKQLSTLPSNSEYASRNAPEPKPFQQEALDKLLAFETASEAEKRSMYDEYIRKADELHEYMNSPDPENLHEIYAQIESKDLTDFPSASLVRAQALADLTTQKDLLRPKAPLPRFQSTFEDWCSLQHQILEKAYNAEAVRAETDLAQAKATQAFLDEINSIWPHPNP